MGENDMSGPPFFINLCVKYVGPTRFIVFLRSNCHVSVTSVPRQMETESI
jgi:hypothetical protein